MHRNLEERVEAITPVDRPRPAQRLWEILDVSLQDQRQAWEMQADGSYRQRTPHEDASHEAHIGTQQTLIERAMKSRRLRGDAAG